MRGLECSALRDSLTIEERFSSRRGQTLSRSVAIRISSIWTLGLLLKHDEIERKI